MDGDSGTGFKCAAIQVLQTLQNTLSVLPAVASAAELPVLSNQEWTVVLVPGLTFYAHLICHEQQSK